MPQQVQFTIGEGFDRYQHPLVDVPSKEREAYKLVAETFGGYSSAHLDGGWIHNAQLIQEPSLQITAVIPDDLVSHVPATAERLRGLFNQESVLVTRQKLDSLDYVNAEEKLAA